MPVITLNVLLKSGIIANFVDMEEFYAQNIIFSQLFGFRSIVVNSRDQLVSCQRNGLSIKVFLILLLTINKSMALDFISKYMINACFICCRKKIGDFNRRKMKNSIDHMGLFTRNE
jgi:hypothetical protein